MAIFSASGPHPARGALSPEWWSWLWTDHGLTTAGFVIGVVSLAITVAGFGVGLWRLARVEKASRSAQSASERTRQIMRSADLRRLLIESSAVTQRIASAPHLIPLRTALTDWIAMYPAVHARLHADSSLPQRAPDQFRSLGEQLERTNIRILLAQDAAGSRAKLKSFSLPVFHQGLSEYRKDIEALLLAADNAMLGEQ